MALQFVYCFFYFLFPLMALYFAHGEDDCTKGIYCGNNLGYLEFPFTEHTKPQCGLIAVNCNDTLHPKVQLGKGGNWYPLVRQVKWEAIITIFLEDLKLQGLIDSHNCSIVNYSLPTFQNSPSITFQVHPPDYNILKCNHSEGKQQICNYGRYKNNCNGGLSLYYKPPWTPEDPKCTVPNSCTPLQMPIIGQIYDKLTAQFEVELQVSEACYECYSGRGRCATAADANINEFRCEKGTSKLKLILITTLGAVVGLVIVIIPLLCFAKKLPFCSSMYVTTERKNYQDVKDVLKSYGPLAPKRFNYSEVKKITDSFTNELGQGGFGSVYKGKLRNGSLVAVKVLKELKASREAFINEVASISRTSHVNIVTLNGFCFEGHKRALVYEFMPNGSLEKFIYESKSHIGRQLGWNILYKISIGIARGLEYLHRGCNTRILHLDIKPHNILLDEDFTPKISDFGLAKLCTKEESIVSVFGARGTIGYIAPEVCRNIGGVSHKSDVYSYGMVVLEMVGGRKNVDIGVSHSSKIYFPHWIYTRLESDDELGLIGVMNEEENECARKMVIVSLWCIQTDPSTRPSMSKVVEMLEGKLECLQVPPKPYLYSPTRSEKHHSSSHSSSVFAS